LTTISVNSISGGPEETGPRREHLRWCEPVQQFDSRSFRKSGSW